MASTANQTATQHLVTGATGFVGGAMALELLVRTDAELVCLVRGEDDKAATKRLHDALVHAAEVYDMRDLVPAVLERTRAVAGDMTDVDVAATAERIGTVEAVWHVAASLKYEDRHADEIELMNVTGVHNILALAKALGEPVFNHVSTAYVAGKRTGLQKETFPENTEWANNVYEATKTVGEQAVRDSGLPWRILRPSVVIGHSVTRAATSFTGLYGFISSVLRFKRSVEADLGNLLSHRRVPIIADPGIECDLVPVDFVARNGVQAGLSGELGRIYHLNNSTAPSIGLMIEETFDVAGLRGPQFVDNQGMLTAVDKKLDDGIQFYASYFINGKHFDQTNTDAVCGAEASVFPMDRESLRGFIQWYIDRIREDGRGAAPKRADFAYKKSRTPASVA
ncbi:SDR family oxidoreductase [Streptomyces sp. NK08204]|uniref:SDR family oxidoreductase n=1 Tax=Streptomyces sp. NK08204 TaxID=2873260 RepID=UPI001CEC8232|nr:SDR family oxidoreductase [Streptomyces sp. NK08204]